LRFKKKINFLYYQKIVPELTGLGRSTIEVLGILNPKQGTEKVYSWYRTILIHFLGAPTIHITDS
jgi:hypothetical protein